MMRPHLFDSWSGVAAQLQSAATVALFLDFDGTLVRLRARPEDATLDSQTRAALKRLACRPRVRVFIISGRGRADLKAKIGVRRLRYLGLHGWEGRAELGGAAQSLMAEVRGALARRGGLMAGIHVEDKGPIVAVHYRNASGMAVAEARTALRRAIESTGARLRLLEGDRVWEILPHNVGGKGAAARRHLRAYCHGALPVYVGNDGTDEPAFAALATGITVRVGPARQTRARFQLNHPREVRQFLERLEAELSHDHSGQAIRIRDGVLPDAHR